MTDSAADYTAKEREEKNIITVPLSVYVNKESFLDGYTIDPQAFYDYYEAKNWCIGNIPIKDWQAKIIKWENGGENTSSFASIGDCLRLPKLAQQGGAQ